MAHIEKRGMNTWRLIVDTGFDKQGKRIRETRSIKIEDKALLRTTKRLQDYLDDELHKFKMEVEAGEYIRPEKMILDEFIEKEWEPKYASNTDNLSPITFKT